MKVKLDLEKLYNENYSRYSPELFLENNVAPLFYGGVIEKHTTENKTSYLLYSGGGSRSGRLLAGNQEECDVMEVIGPDRTLLKTSKGVLHLSKREYDIATEEAVTEKSADTSAHDAEIRARTIDEFAKELKDSTPQIAQDTSEEMVSVKVPKSLLESEGETVYYIMDGEICECDLCSIVIDTKGVWVALLSDDYIFPVRTPNPEFDDDPQDWCEKGTLVSADEWGKALFPTRERAEAYLEAEEEAER